MPAFEITVEREPEGVRVRVMGELDLATVSELNDLLDRIVHEGHKRLELDLDGVEFIDCAGLSGIIHAQRSTVGNGRALTIRYSSPQVHRLFELTDMLQYLTFERLTDGRLPG